MVALNDDVRILVVDDNFDILSIVSRLLREAGYAVMEAATGQKCLQLAQEENPDIILLDVNLPDMSGIEVCRRLKADPQLSSILIAHLSATATSSESQAAGLEAGADAYIVQPLSHRELLARVEALARLKRTEDALREVSQFNQQIIASVQEGIIVLDRQFRFVLWNPFMEELGGIPARDAIGKRPWELFPFLPEEEIAPLLQRALDGETVYDSDRSGVSLRTGEVNRVSVRLSPFRNHHGEIVGVLATIHDITERKQTEEQYRSIFENAAEGIFRTTPEGRFLLANLALARMLGYESPEELIVHVTDIGQQLYVHPEQRLLFKQLLEEHGSVQGFEIQFYHKDGSILWATVNARAVRDKEGRLLYYEGTNTDITQRKRAEQLQAVVYHIANVAHQNVNMDDLYRFIHQEVSGILDAHNFYIALYDAAQDLLLFPYYADETRADPTQVSGHSRKLRKGLTEYVLRTGQSLLVCEKDIQELAEKGEIELIGTLPRVWLGAPLKSGDKIIGVIAVQSYTNPAAYTQKELEFLEFISSQIGGAIERKRAEETLQETNLRLEHALAELQRMQENIVQQERLRAIGTMASGIAHDFNNALAPILGYSELLLAHPDDLSDRERVQRYLERMNVAAQDAAHVVSRLREFYRRRDEGEVFLPVHLNQIVEQAIPLTQPKWKTQAQAKGIAIQVQTDLRPVPTMMGNESDLREMLTNLIFNAVDAMPQGGTITIRTRMEVWEYGSMGEETPTFPSSPPPPRSF